MDRDANGAPDLGAFDDAVAVTEDIDRFCSSSPWVLSAWEAFHSEHSCHVWSDGECSGAFLRGEMAPVGPYLMPLESVWGLACPIAGRSPDVTARVARMRLEAIRSRWNVALIGGLVVASPLVAALVREFGGRFALRTTPPVARHIASLDGGFDGFLGRRTRRFRANLRRDSRAGSDAGVDYERCLLDDPDAVAEVFPRILAVERESWKTKAGSGVAEGPMRVFNEAVLRRATASGDARVAFARIDDHDVGYIHGAVVGDYFRGLQQSFDDHYRSLTIGNLLQVEMIDWLCNDGVRRYDLGSELPYKRRWAEEELVTASIIVTP